MAAVEEEAFLTESFTFFVRVVGYSDGYVARRGSAFEPGVQTPNTNIHSQLSYKVDLFVGKNGNLERFLNLLCQTKPACQLNVGKNFNFYWY